MNHELPWYNLSVDERYPRLVRPNYYAKGTVNFATLYQWKGKYEWVVTENAACCYTLREGHAVAFELRMPTAGTSASDYARQYARASQQWLLFLTGEYSPWKDALKDFEIIHDPDCGVACGIIVKDCRVSRALLHNFFLALRCIWEYKADVAFFGKLVDLGVPPQAAIYYAFTIIREGDNISSWRLNGHTWMNSPYINHPLMSRLFKLDPRFVPPVLFTESARDIDDQFIHSNQMWHEGDGQTAANPHPNLTPPCLDEFPSVMVMPPSPGNPTLDQQRRVPMKDFFAEVPVAWMKRFNIERRVAGHMI